jgi:Ca2+-binding RTX toxin-like protein
VTALKWWWKPETLIPGGPGNDGALGSQGSDKVVGGMGNDYLTDAGNLAEPSKDNLSGGEGNDVFDVVDKPAFRDALTCGRGFDRVIADRKDVVAPDCEKISSPSCGSGATGS